MPRRRTGRRGRTGIQGISSPVVGTLSINASSIDLTAFAGESTVNAGEAFTIDNVGSGSLAGPQLSIAYTSGSAWLSLASSIDVNGLITVTPTAVATALSAGTYTGTITVTDSSASNSPQTVAVSLIVSAYVPQISAIPTALTFSLPDETAGTASTVQVFNSANGTLATPTIGVITYVGAFTGWVSSTAVAANGDGTFTVSVTPTAVGGTVGGPYTATIPIVSAGASNTPYSITAALTVTAAAAAVLALDRTLDDATGTIGGSNPANQTVGVKSANNSALAGPYIDSSSYTGTHSGWGTASMSGNTLTVAISISGISTAGTSYFNVVVKDPNASGSVTYQVFLKVSQTVAPAALTVAPSAIATSAVNGSSPASTTIAIANGGGGGLAGLGTVGATLSPNVSWANVSYANGAATLSFTTTALGNGTYSTSVVVTSSTATNSPVTVPVQVVISAAVGTYPRPLYATIPVGYTWNTSLGYPEGSCFNEISPSHQAANGARPAFAGTVHTIPGSYATWPLAMTAVTAGTIVPGDIIRISAATTITDPQFPIIPGWTLGDGFICVQSANMASLPAYSYASGPASYGVDNRGGKDAHLQYMPKMKTVSLNRSVLNFQQGTAGWWLEGIDIWADTAQVTAAVVSLRPRNGTQAAGQGTLTNIPRCIVIDRCRFRSTSGHQNVLEADARYVRLTHNTMDYARRPGLASDNNENKVAYIINTDGKMDILGNDTSSLGIGFLIGGAEPAVNNITPADIAIMWNRYSVPDLTGLPDQDDSKNFYENKTGIRCFVAFNRVTGLWMRPDQKAQFLFKAVDPPNLTGGVCNNPQNLYAAHVKDVIYWGNIHYNCAKGFFGGGDIFNGGCGIGGAIGTERIEVAYNLSEATWTGKIPSKWVLGSVDRMQLQLYKSAGDGIPGVYCYHNTFGSTDFADQDFLELDSVALGTAWTNVWLKDNVMFSAPLYGPVRGNQSSNTTALNGTFGPGNWVLAYNVVKPGNAVWDATLSGGNYNNGYLQSGPTTNNFVDAANRNYTLITGHPKKGISSDGTDPGYNHTYITAMTATVLTNAGV